MSTTPISIPIATALRRELLRLARAEEELAADEAAAVPYWSPCPPTVVGHRLASAILRADADRFLQPTDPTLDDAA
ncbi:hypothetical protein [Nocardioides sp.]|jgi:hypothetical protein|uniref:hypothetical protein n=1 Tax=Nocardioides sp. TaxID=35761 RepID=UPI0031FE608A|nr:hypothetical protein [Nocardioides sp.]